jgi:hypothetical protein
MVEEVTCYLGDLGTGKVWNEFISLVGRAQWQAVANYKVTLIAITS